MELFNTAEQIKEYKGKEWQKNFNQEDDEITKCQSENKLYLEHLLKNSENMDVVYACCKRICTNWDTIFELENRRLARWENNKQVKIYEELREKF